jgi:hypothetical protein
VLTRTDETILHTGVVTKIRSHAFIDGFTIYHIDHLIYRRRGKRE